MFILHFRCTRNVKCPIKFSVEDRAKCRVLFMYSFDDMSCTNPAAPNVMKPLSILYRKYETLYEEISTKSNDELCIA